VSDLKRAIVTASVVRSESSESGRVLLDHVSERLLQHLSPDLKNTLYKRNTSSVDSLLSTGIPISSLKSEVTRLAGAWKNAPKINVVQSVSDLPFAAPSDARGAYLRGQVWLVADNLHAPEDAQTVHYHEVHGHAGLRGVFGDQLNGALNGLAMKNENIRQAAAKWRSENGDIRGTRDDAQWRAVSIEETLADIAGTGKQIKGLDNFLAAIQSALRAMGLDHVANWMEKLSNAEAM
jgi:hypothetical protein